MMPDRAKINTSSEAGEVNEFLTQINNCSEFGIIVIAATNKPEMIDSAILRSGRIELKFFISEPDYETRIQLFLEYVKNRNVNKNIDYNFLARLTDNYVTADIKLIVDTAARLAFRQKKEFIEQNDFVNAIEKVKPSVSIQELNRYKLCFDNYTMEC